MPLFSHLPNDGIRPDKPIFLLRCPIDSLMLELCLLSSAGHLVHLVLLIQVTLPLSAPYVILLSVSLNPASSSYLNVLSCPSALVYLILGLSCYSRVADI